MSHVVMADPVADMLTRIRNAMAVRKHEISLPHSNYKEAVAKVLEKHKFVDKVAAGGEGLAKTLTISINAADQNARITSITMLSKPGRRMYVSAKEIPRVKRGRGLVIVSTSKGIMTGDEAKAAGIGGEIICEVY